MGGDGARRAALLAAQDRANGAAPRDLERDAELVELLTDTADDIVRVAGRARDREELLQRGGEVIEVDMQNRHAGGLCRTP